MKPNIPQKIEKYSNHLIDSNIQFKGFNQKDEEIIKEIIMPNMKFSTLNNSFFSFKEMHHFLREHTLKANKMSINIKGDSEIQDKVHQEVDLTYSKFHLSPLMNFSYLKDGKFTLKGNRIYGNDNKNEFSLGLNFKFNNMKKEFFIENLYLINDSVEAKFKISTFRCFKDINRRQSGVTQNLQLIKHFNKRPLLFKDFPYFNHENSVSLSVTHSLIKNYVDYKDSSYQLIAGTPSQDSVVSIGLNYNFSLFSHNNYFKNRHLIISNRDFDILYFNSSLKYFSSLNSNYLRSKIKLKKFYPLHKNINLMTTLEAQNTILCNKTRLLKSHETLLVEDFKGVINPGPKISDTKDSIGMFNIVKLYTKLYFCDIFQPNYKPLASSFLPFIHCSLLYHYNDPQFIFISKRNLESSRNLTTISNTEPQNFSNLYFSTGLGISYLTELGSLELFYNSYIKKNVNDLGQELGFSISSE